MRVWVEYPYDVGFPHKLRGEDGTEAVISAAVAGELIASGVPDQAPGAEPGMCPGCLSVDGRLSKKARRMLGVK